MRAAPSPSSRAWKRASSKAAADRGPSVAKEPGRADLDPEPGVIVTCTAEHFFAPRLSSASAPAPHLRRSGRRSGCGASRARQHDPGQGCEWRRCAADLCRQAERRGAGQDQGHERQRGDRHALWRQRLVPGADRGPARRSSTSMGIKVIAVTDAGFKADKQVSDIETVMAQKPNIIVWHPDGPGRHRGRLQGRCRRRA